MIRIMALGDAAAMAEIHAASFYKSWSPEDMCSHVKTDIVLGHGDPLDGFLIIRMAADQAELLTIAVNTEKRRSGLATDILLAGEETAQKSGADILFLELAEDNPAALAFYRKHNYEEFARRPAYYARANGRVAARLFRKQL